MNMQAFDDFLINISNEPLKVIDAAILLEDYMAIDLSVTNPALAEVDVSSSKAMETYIKASLKKNHAIVAYGGYLEKRAIYSRSTYFKQDIPENDRNIHLGIDIWSRTGTKVLAALEGEIHSFQNNTNFGDYGPTIILKHKVKSIEFYSLYGHLSLDSLANLKIGAKIRKSATIGYLGDSSVNGDYAPHLHFQIMKDMQGFFGDYPGVSSQKDIDFYKVNCPDPNLLLKIF